MYSKVHTFLPSHPWRNLVESCRWYSRRNERHPVTKIMKENREFMQPIIGQLQMDKKTKISILLPKKSAGFSVFNYWRGFAKMVTGQPLKSSG